MATALFARAATADESIPLANRKETILGSIITFQILAWIAGALRFYTRLRIQKSPGWDDFFLLVVLVTTTVGVICTCLSAYVGLGTHFLSHKLPDLVTYGLYYYIAFITYALSTSFIKVSLLLQYLRIFETGRQRILCQGLLVLTAIWGTVFSVLAIVPCWPIEGFWDWSKPSKCFMFGSRQGTEFALAYITHAALNMILDIAVLAIPLTLLRRPNLARKQVLGLLAVFFIGSIVISISIIRFVTILHSRAGTYPTYDPTWTTPISVIFSCLEIELAVVAASIPTFWPMLIDLGFGKILIVQEIEVQAEDRIELSTHRNGTNSSRRGSSSGSEVELNRTRSGSSGGDGMERHYKDQYIINQVLPMPSTVTREVKVERAKVPHEYVKSIRK